ncbi:MAG: hypothetical protein OD918_04565 [Gammaproteobacteria bacterium]
MPPAQRRLAPQKSDRLREVVGLLPMRLRRTMQVACREVMLSGYTIGKLKHDRPGIAPRKFVLVQRILDGEWVYVDGANHYIGFARDDDGKWWTAVWKKTRDEREVFLETFHRGGIKGRLREAAPL